MPVPTTAGDLSSQDFELFWEWLTYKKNSPLTARMAEISKIIRVFETLDIFEDRDGAVKFVKSWETDNRHTLLAYEFRVGLLRLAPSQFQKFYRFINALQVKDREDKAKAKKKEQEKQIIRQRRNRKGSQYEKALQARKEKRSNRSLAVHPAKEKEGKDLKDNSINERDIRTFKEKHGIKEKPGSVSKFMTFVRAVSERSLEALSPSKLLKRGSTSSVSDSSTDALGGSSNLNLCQEESANDTITSMERAISSDSDDSFTSRLSRASLSIFQEHICGDEAMSSYRKFDVPSDIVESLESFGSINKSSSGFEQLEVCDF